MPPDLFQAVKAAGFQYCDDLIHLFVGGSQLHGAKVEGTDDIDIFGVYVEPREKILGLDHCEHFVWSTSDQYERNTAADTDITLYSLRKFAGLACKGNPSALHFLFAPNVAPQPQFWNALAPEIKKCVLSKAAMSQFVGFIESQMGRLLGTRGRGKKGQRPELEAKYGFDVKAAMHAVRLCYECIELLQDATITQPRPEAERLIAIRSGQWSLDKVSNEVSKLLMLIERAEVYSPLGEHPNRERLSEVIAEAYMEFWTRETNARNSRTASREANERRKAVEKKTQDDCPHLSGSIQGVGGDPSHYTCIVWHTFEDDPEHAVGLCMHCGKQWRYTDPDYADWKKRPTLNKPSTGGLRVLRSSAAPHMPGTPILPGPGLIQERGSTDWLRVESLELPGEPMNLTLHEFILSEVLKKHPEKAAKIIVAANKGPLTLKPILEKLGGIA